MSLITETARYRINRSIHGKVVVTMTNRAKEYQAAHKVVESLEIGQTVRICDVLSVSASMVGQIGQIHSSVRNAATTWYWLSGVGDYPAGPYCSEELELA